MKKILFKLLAMFIAFLLVLLTIVLVYSINGFVLMKLWNWFIVPIGFYIGNITLHIEQITFYEAVGIYIFCSFLFYRQVTSKNDAYKVLLYSILIPITSLLIGYLFINLF